MQPLSFSWAQGLHCSLVWPCDQVLANGMWKKMMCATTGYFVEKKLFVLHFLFVLRSEKNVDNKAALTMQLRITPWRMTKQQGRRNLGHWRFARYTTAVLGLGFIRDKDLNAFISEMIPGNTGREWESETEKGKKPMKCILPSHYLHGQLELKHNGNTGRECRMTQSYPAQEARELESDRDWRKGPFIPWYLESA